MADANVFIVNIELKRGLRKRRHKVAAWMGTCAAEQKACYQDNILMAQPAARGYVTTATLSTWSGNVASNPGSLARYELDRRGSRVGTRDVIEDACGVAVVLRTVRRVDLVVDIVGSDLHKGNVFIEATSLNAPFVPYLNATKPRRGSSVNGSDVEVVTVTDDPNRHGTAQRA